MDRLLVVSNRLLVTVTRRKGELAFRPSVGGLATGLGSFYRKWNGGWIGWPGTTLNKKEERVVKSRLKSEFDCYPVFLSSRDIEGYYHGFSNKTIWPLFHYFPQYVEHSRSYWDAYKRVNKIFCNRTTQIARPGDIIWVHDYHLMLLPQLIRERLPDARIGFFLHIPFPSLEIFRLLPWREEILKGLLGADIIGFHTYDYTRHFLSSVLRLLGYEHSLGQIIFDNRTVRTDVFPMGIDFDKYAGAYGDPKVEAETEKVRKEIGRRKVILSVDRLDYTKGIPERLEAFDQFLTAHPKWHRKVSLILVAAPSRTRVEHYRLLKKQIDELIGRINGKHGTLGWSPIWYLHRTLPFENLAALYNVADVALITPCRDGMNLIAKEYLAARKDETGVLILSETTGASKELGEAITVNANNKEEIVGAIKHALTMSKEEQMARNRPMRERLQRYTVMRWAEDFVGRLLETKKTGGPYTKKLTSALRDRLLDDCCKSRSRLIFLDYDGTLVPFARRPEETMPSADLIRLLKSLTNSSRNHVVLLSSRNKDVLEKWFGRLPIGLVAEHGLWLRDKKSWESAEGLTTNWKEQIRPLFEVFVDRVPGSYVEEKDFSLIWHFRDAEPGLGSMRAQELTYELIGLTANINLQVLPGNKAVEVKNAGIHKGSALLRWLPKADWEFILAIGDDITDEHVFRSLPGSAYSIKVGLGLSNARFTLESSDRVLELLKDLSHRVKQQERKKKTK